MERESLYEGYSRYSSYKESPTPCLDIWKGKIFPDDYFMMKTNKAGFLNPDLYLYKVNEIDPVNNTT